MVTYVFYALLKKQLAAERGSSDLAGSTRVASPTCHRLDVRNEREGPRDSLNNRSLLFWIFPNPKTGKILKTNPLIMAFPFFMRIQHIPNLTAESFIRMKPLILKSKRNILVKWIWELRYYFCLTAAGRKLQDHSKCTLPFLLRSPANSPTLALSRAHSHWHLLSSGPIITCVNTGPGWVSLLSVSLHSQWCCQMHLSDLRTALDPFCA